jgi:hypothetical protein
MSEIIVINGDRRPIRFSGEGRTGFDGAGYVGPVEDGRQRLLFKARPRDVRGIAQGEADGVRVRVISVAQSRTVPALVEMIVEPV